MRFGVWTIVVLALGVLRPEPASAQAAPAAMCNVTLPNGVTRPWGKTPRPTLTEQRHWQCFCGTTAR